MSSLRPLLLAFFLCAMLPLAAQACGVLPALGPLMSYARAVELGDPVGRGDTLTAVRVRAGTDTAALPQRMRQAGHGDQTGAVLAFFAAFDRLLERAAAGDMTSARRYARSDVFGRSFAGAEQAHQAVCVGDGDASTSGEASAGRPARVGGDGHGASVRRGLSPYETPLATSAQRMVISFIGLLSAVILVHYALLWRQTAQRRRRLVSIPAILRAGTGGLAGRITVLEVQGAKFVAGDALRGSLAAGMPLTLSVGDMQIDAQVLSSGKIAQHLSFDTALEPEAYTDLLAASVTAPRRDPMARDRSFGADGGYRYGQAHVLSTARRAETGRVTRAGVRPPDRKVAFPRSSPRAAGPGS